MSGHLFIESQVAELMRRELLAASAKRAELEGYSSISRLPKQGALRVRLGTAVLQAGHRLQGAEAISPSGGKPDPIASTSQHQ